jgi:hypothetical protein
MVYSHMNTISKDTPLTREYLQSLKEYNEEILKPIFDEFLLKLRKSVINCATDGAIAVSVGFPVKLRKHADKFMPMLEDNFPGCKITLDKYNDIVVEWDVFTSEAGKGET